MITWLFGTAIGRTIFTALLVLASWWAFSSYYHAQGVKDGETACQAAAAKAALAQEAKGRPIAQAADKANQAAVTEVPKTEAAATVRIEKVYVDRIKTVPAVPGSCVHPVDPAVQAELQAALQRANGGAL